MPEIDFSTWPEGLQSVPLWAVMMFPNDPGRRDEFLMMAQGQARLFDPEGEQSTLYNVLAHARRAHFEEGRPVLHGTLAGNVLTVSRIIAEQHGKYPATIDRAVAVVAADAKGQRTLDERFPVPSSPRGVRSAWREYRSVAHLWAALGLLLDERRRDLANTGSDPDDLEDLAAVLDDLPKLLAVAIDMLVFGVNHLLENKAAGGIRQPLLDLEAAWLPPPAVLLPDIEVRPPPLSPPAFAVLRRFQSAQRG